MTFVVCALYIGALAILLLALWLNKISKELREAESEIASLEHIVTGHGRRLSWAEEGIRACRVKQSMTSAKHPPDMDDGK